MNRRLLIVAALFGALVTPGVSAAQSVKSSVVATNGVEVTVYSDEFAQRYEYTAPIIEFTDGYVLVAWVRTADSPGSVKLVGTFNYSGDWRFYNSAIFRGGASATFAEAGREVVSCRGSRYGSGCSLSEGFRIAITAAEVAQHMVDGKLAIQVRASKTANTAMFEIPQSYIEAVTEVATR